VKGKESPSSTTAATNPEATKERRKRPKGDGMDPFYKEIEGQLAATDLESID